MSTFREPAAKADNVPETARFYHVRVEPAGVETQVSSTASILLTLESTGLQLPSSCLNGTCRTCICQMASGSVSYPIEWPGLSLDEKLAGFILPCIARPTSDLVLDMPGAKMVDFSGAE